MSQLDWKDIASWCYRLIESYPEELPDNLFQLAAREDREKFYADDLSWLNRLRDKVGLDTSVELDILIASDFTRTFETIRTYHACRPVDVGRYLRYGLELSRAENIKAEALILFTSLGVTEAEIDRVCASDGLCDRAGVCFLSLDDREFADLCGHYLIYGSEWLQGIAAKLHSDYGDRPRYILRERGIPTIFEIDLPVELVGPDILKELARNMLATLFEYYGRFPRATPCIDFTFTIRKPVPASQICNHTHPACIRDPQDWRWYKQPSVRCEYCQSFA